MSLRSKRFCGMFSTRLTRSACCGTSTAMYWKKEAPRLEGDPVAALVETNRGEGIDPGPMSTAARYVREDDIPLPLVLRAAEAVAAGGQRRGAGVEITMAPKTSGEPLAARQAPNRQREPETTSGDRQPQ